MPANLFRGYARNDRTVPYIPRESFGRLADFVQTCAGRKGRAHNVVLPACVEYAAISVDAALDTAVNCLSPRLLFNHRDFSAQR